VATSVDRSAQATQNLTGPVDCSGRTSRQVLEAILPECLEARDRGKRASIRVENLELLSDAVTRLLKAFDRLSADRGAEIRLADSCGFAGTFLDALSGRAHVTHAGED
jgi:hypothetical protein